MIEQIINTNRKKFIGYNQLRKDIFSEISPKESEVVLYLLPWLLSINHPDCPGYLVDMKGAFQVHDISNHREIKKKEPGFMELFGVTEKRSMLRPHPRILAIQGVYTIGSVGTIGQTHESDCDIWVCYEGKDFSEEELTQLQKKVYLIGEWISENCRLPVYFFVSDVADIRCSRFGSVDEESSGSAQANVLKEEFYRTCMVVAGKIPLWWVCYDNSGKMTYAGALKTIHNPNFWDDSYVDMGNLENVAADEYFGAALWQIQKSLERPLKSILKMFMLKMQLDAADDDLVCHKFRQHIMIKKTENMISDPSVFSMFFIMNYYLERGDSDTIEFIKECYYLRCEIKPYSKKFKLKNSLAAKFFDQFEIDKYQRERLNKFNTWALDQQIRFGRKIFLQLMQCYREIVASHSGVTSRIGKKDLTVVGRKIQVYYEAKKDKILILPKPGPRLNISGLSFMYEEERWHVFSGNDRAGHIINDRDIVFTIAFVVRNGLFEPGRIHMLPNRTSIEVSEIIALGNHIEAFFILNRPQIKQKRFLRKATVVKVLIVISFEEEPWEKSWENIRLVYMNSWGEVFVKQVSSPAEFKQFLKENGGRKDLVEVQYYLQKKCLNYSATLNEVKHFYSP